MREGACGGSVGKPIGIGLIGCGVVGTGVLRLLAEHKTSIEARIGAELVVRGIAVSDPSRERDPIVPATLLTTDAETLVRADDVDIVVEVMGGTGRAGTLVRSALEHGKHVVTANKALLAEDGVALGALAEAKGKDLYYEAAVAGGIPIIRVLREGLTSDRVRAVYGIVNGTSNYILSRMRSAGLDFAVALAEAQAAGYAEADPTLDVGGGDAAHKLTVLARLAFCEHVRTEHIATEGIDRVSRLDMQFAQRFGYEIKPLAIAQRLPDGRLDLRVHPALVKEDAALAGINGALNAVYVHGELVGPSLLSGLGAGAGPTAVSVVADVVDVAQNHVAGAPARKAAGVRNDSRAVSPQPIGELVSSYYVRMTVKDRPGVLARVTGSLAQHAVSIEQMVQQRPERASTEVAAVLVFLTHDARESDLRAAIAEIDASNDVVERTNVIRIVEQA
jgi:homoserine dehydrogenase